MTLTKAFLYANELFMQFDLGARDGFLSKRPRYDEIAFQIASNETGFSIAKLEKKAEEYQ